MASSTDDSDVFKVLEKFKLIERENERKTAELLQLRETLKAKRTLQATAEAELRLARQDLAKISAKSDQVIAEKAVNTIAIKEENTRLDEIRAVLYDLVSTRNQMEADVAAMTVSRSQALKEVMSKLDFDTVANKYRAEVEAARRGGNAIRAEMKALKEKVDEIRFAHSFTCTSIGYGTSLHGTLAFKAPTRPYRGFPDVSLSRTGLEREGAAQAQG